MKRFFSFVIALALVFSLCPGFFAAASADGQPPIY